ncbi:MAG: hypothetical protein QNI89_02795 [Desulfobacterales bacterium]|nr:hypothetical protein [Desulfobacterales bacterium]MDJ0855443.1 hypothetical protein [Desulfobacterales bacterium]MDJ0886196.1 hypothetical protein [Desulfobacterales bacterium]MDJ0990751.1 hypothetical protein [Desulfobacterales bacterium]
MIEIAGLVVAGVTALGTVVQAFHTARAKNRRVSRASLKKAEARARAPLKIGAKRVAEVIDRELLETLQHEIENRHKQLVQAFRSDRISELERERQVEAARQQICRFLDAVRKFNAGRLPTRRLEDLWVSNRCDS